MRSTPAFLAAALLLSVAPLQAKRLLTGNPGAVYGLVQEGEAGTRARVLLARVGRPTIAESYTPIYSSFEEAIVLVEVLAGAEDAAELQLHFGEGEDAKVFPAPRVRSRSKEFELYAEPTGRIFEARFPIAAVYEAPEETRNTTYSIFRTTDNDDTLTFKAGMTGGKLPGEQLLFVNNSESVELEYDENGMPICRDLRGAAPCETFNAGGVEPLPFRVGAGDLALMDSELLIERVPDWIYFSGHYPRGSGGHLLEASIYPEEIPGTNWPGALEVLVFASCYAVEINTSAAPDFQTGYGIDGARWWKKFQGTLLGYRHLAPSRAASAVTRNFLRRVRESDVSPTKDPDGWSRMLAEAWMRGNTMDGTLATNAAAVDSQGRYYAVNNRDLVLEGLQYRTGIRWQTVEQDLWSPQYERTIGEYGAGKVLMEAENLINPYGEAPPTMEELLASDAYRELAARFGVPPDDPDVVTALREALTTARKEHYESGDIWRWESVVYQQVEDLGGERPPTPEEIRAVFQTDDPDIVPKHLPPEELEAMLFRNYCYTVYANAQEWDEESQSYRYTTPPAEVRAKVARFFDLTPERLAFLAETFPEGGAE
jgi:hypothetical protein